MGERHRVVLITGAGSGIGLAAAKLLLRGPYRAVLTARSKSLKHLQQNGFADSSECMLRELDVTVSAQRESIIREVGERWGGIDVLINNAGISYRSVQEHMTDEDEVLQLRTNFLGPMALTRLVLPYMRQVRRGHIINVSSVGGMMAMPTMGSYSASKFALEGASEALWYEVKPWNISVSLVQPGFINSNSFRNVYLSAKAKESMQSDGGYAVYYKGMGAFIEKFMSKAKATPESVAQRILSVMENPNPALRVPATADAYFFATLRRVLPRRMYHWLLYRNLPGVKEWGKQSS